MTYFPTKHLRMIAAFFVLFFHLSCSTDTDLLSEIVIPDSSKAFLEIKVIAVRNEAVVINVTDEGVVGQVTDVTDPENGTAAINEDNTITYTPDADAVGTDEFAFMVDTPNPDNTITTETGSIQVTITPNIKTPTDGNEVNFSKYGAKGDGVTDDTKAIQAALDSELNIVGTLGATYRISGTLDIDRKGNQTVDWKGATLLIGVELSKCVDINKPEGLLKMNNLNIDANLKGEWIIQMNSSFEFDNIKIKDVFSNDQAAVGFYVRITKSGNWTRAKLSNCTVDNIRSENNNVIGDNMGAARALLYDFITTPQNLHGLIENCEFRNAFGEDGDIFQYRSNDQNWNSGSTLTFNNTKFETATRRIGKIFAGDVKFYNCTFTNIAKSNPNIRYAKETGGFLSLSNTAGKDPARRIIFDNCVFNGSDFDNRIIQNKATDISITNSIFNNTDYRMWQYGGGVCIRNNTFSETTKIYTVAFTTWYGPMVVEGNKNTSINFNEFLNSNPPAIANYECPK